MSSSDRWRLVIVLLACWICTYIFFLWYKCQKEAFIVTALDNKNDVVSSSPARLPAQSPVSTQVTIDPSTNIMHSIASSIGNLNNNISQLSADVNKMRINQETQQAKQDAQEAERDRQRMQ